MKDLIETLEAIKEYQMNNVELARTTEVYKLADKALKQVKLFAIPVVSGWRSFSEEKPLDGERYHYTQGSQFFKGIWNEEMKGFLLDGCEGKMISKSCDYFHACH